MAGDVKRVDQAQVDDVDAQLRVHHVTQRLFNSAATIRAGYAVTRENSDATDRHTRRMRLYPEEPEAPSWEALDEVALATRIRGMLGTGERALVLVDGRSGAGKTTFAAGVARLLDGTLVHTDYISWHHDPIDWAQLLLDEVISPWRRGEAVSFRPPGWVLKARPGAVEVPPGSLLVVEGVGAGRAELAPWAELVVWVQSDRVTARRRGIARDVEYGRSPGEAEAFWDEWMSAEEPFLAADRPWSRASLVVNGTPPAAMRSRTLVAPGPLSAREG